MFFFAARRAALACASASRAEERGAHAHHGAARLHCGFEVARHAHRQRVDFQPGVAQRVEQSPRALVHRQLRGISSDRAVGLGPNKVLSVPDAIGVALEEWMRMKQGVQQDLLATPVVASADADAPVLEAAPVVAGSAGELLQLEGKSGDSHLVGACPDCGSQLEYAEGCVKCHVCGFSECG